MIGISASRMRWRLEMKSSNSPNVFPMCKGKNCGCTDGASHSPECLEEHDDAIAGVLGLCSVPMWRSGLPAGICGKKAYGYRPPSRQWMNYASGEMMRTDLKYNGYVPGLACSTHGGPDAKEVVMKGCSVCGSSEEQNRRQDHHRSLRPNQKRGAGGSGEDC
jgi:hypothetical protein